MENKIKRNITQFAGDRYSIWKFRIKSLLSENNLLCVIEDETPDMLGQLWLKKEANAKNIMIEYLADSFLCFTGPDKSSKQILHDLDAIYERKSLASQLSIRKKLLVLKYESEKPLLTHFNTFDDLVTELMAAGAKLDEMDKVSHLLLTLPSSYDGVVTAIETLTEGSLAFVKTRLLDQEIKINYDHKDTSHKVLQVITNKPHNFNNARKQNTKNNYNRQNRFKPINKQIHKTNAKYHHCSRKGHFKKDCYYFKKSTANKTTEENTAQIAVAEGFAFMLGHQTLMENRNTFLLDSGASDHIIKTYELFKTCAELKPPLKISVAKNGEFIKATHKGLVELLTKDNERLILQDVLFCKEVPYNLLSVKKMQHVGMSVEFNDKGISVKRDGKVIITGNNESCLPVIVFKSYQVNSVINNEYELWHQRLGHIGQAKFAEIKNYNMFQDIEKIKIIKANSQICEACLKGKQSRLKYEKAKSKEHVNRPLFIIHTDVCGPITPLTVDEKNIMSFSSTNLRIIV